MQIRWSRLGGPARREGPPEGGGGGGEEDAGEVGDGVLVGGAGGVPEADFVGDFLGGAGGEGDEGGEGEWPAAEEGAAGAVEGGGEDGGDEVAEEDVVELVPCPPLVTAFHPSGRDGAALDLFICCFKHPFYWVYSERESWEGKIVIKWILFLIMAFDDMNVFFSFSFFLNLKWFKINKKKPNTGIIWFLVIYYFCIWLFTRDFDLT